MKATITTMAGTQEQDVTLEVIHAPPDTPTAQVHLIISSDNGSSQIVLSLPEVEQLERAIRVMAAKERARMSGARSGSL